MHVHVCMQLCVHICTYKCICKYVYMYMYYVWCIYDHNNYICILYAYFDHMTIIYITGATPISLLKVLLSPPSSFQLILGPGRLLFNGMNHFL